jgi:hypothetical protein
MKNNKNSMHMYIYRQKERGRLYEIGHVSNMNIFNSDCINILDFPDEILRVIFDKLNMVDVFYSLVGVNQRFDRLALDSVYTHHLHFVIKPLIKCYTSSVDHQVLDKICRKVLPRIHCKIDKLTVEPLSMECVLDTANYPQLHSLSLVNFPKETLLQHLRGLFVNLLL